ncbi:hypothetical protein EI94DRAFT_1798663 [Lactarius quietus]|nr:hypothetical protein EI94DRAFT_1798663 [Lactarius quietus]
MNRSAQTFHSTRDQLLSDIPTRLFGWFRYNFNSSATDLSLTHLINTTPAPSNFAGVQPHGSSPFSFPPASPSPLSKQLSTSSSSSGGAHVRWNSAGANGAGSDLSGAAERRRLGPYPSTLRDIVQLRTSHCERTEDDWIDLRRRVVELFKKRKTIFSIVDELPSWSGADESLKSMSDPDDKEDNMPDYKY